MEEYILLCLDCHEIFSGKENHTCRRNIRTHFAATVEERVSTFDAKIIGFSESCVGDGTNNPTPFEESPNIISTAEKILSDDRRRERKSILETATQENVAFGYSDDSTNVQQQIQNYRERLFVLEPELWTSIPRATPVLQDAHYNSCTAQDVTNSCMSDDEPMEVNLPSTSLRNVGDSAVISSGWDLIEQCEPMNLEAHRRPEDGQFVCPFCGKIVRYKSHFELHYQTHTGYKPYECDVCGYKCNKKSDLERHRLTHTGEKPHKCPICGKGFTRLSTCKTHIENVHRKK